MAGEAQRPFLLVNEPKKTAQLADSSSPEERLCGFADFSHTEIFRERRAKDRGVARSAPCCVLMSLKKRMLAAHMRARPKTH